MSQDRTAATLMTMGEETRGQSIERRRIKHGLSGRRLAKLAGMDPATLRDAEADSESTTDLTYSRIFRALDDFEHETSSEAEEAAEESAAGAGLVEFRVSGNFGVDVTVKGPIADLPELKAAVADLIREVRESQT